jgi:hypothetical protein
VFGGFLLRLVILVVGVLTCVKTGYANPASFGLSFVAAVLLFLGLEIYFVSASLNKKVAPGTAPAQTDKSAE